jgi:hypothetical protein
MDMTVKAMAVMPPQMVAQAPTWHLFELAYAG